MYGGIIFSFFIFIKKTKIIIIGEIEWVCDMPQSEYYQFEDYHKKIMAMDR